MAHQEYSSSPAQHERFHLALQRVPALRLFVQPDDVFVFVQNEHVEAGVTLQILKATIHPSHSRINSHLGLGFLNFLISYGVRVTWGDQLCHVRDAATARRTLRLTYVMGGADVTSAYRGSGITDRASGLVHMDAEHYFVSLCALV